MLATWVILYFYIKYMKQNQEKTLFPVFHTEWLTVTWPNTPSLCIACIKTCYWLRLVISDFSPPLLYLSEHTYFQSLNWKLEILIEPGNWRFIPQTAPILDTKMSAPNTKKKNKKKNRHLENIISWFQKHSEYTQIEDILIHWSHNLI